MTYAMMAWYSRDKSSFRSAISCSLSVVVAIVPPLLCRKFLKLQGDCHLKIWLDRERHMALAVLSKEAECACHERIRVEFGTKRRGSRRRSRDRRGGHLRPADREG